MAEEKNSGVPMTGEEVEDDHHGEFRISSEDRAPGSVMSTSDQSDSEDSCSESEDEENRKLQELEAELSRDPTNYNTHVQYIKCLRKQGDIEKLRESREVMSRLFPLSPSMWQEWAKDEASLVSSNQDAIQSIERLYERGISDYLSVPLWCDYLSFMLERDPLLIDLSPSGISKGRALFETALTSAGSHMVGGSKIWDAYRNFEKDVLNAIPKDQTGNREEQIHRIRSLFHRQLTLPLIDIQSTYSAYKIWETEHGEKDDLELTLSHVAYSYKKAMDELESRSDFEKKIESEKDKLHHFLTYLKYEETSGQPSRVHVLFERAVTEFPVCVEVWLRYTDYMDRTLKTGDAVLNAHSRSIKSCPWISELWVRHLLSLERNNATEDQISAVFHNSLQISFSTFEDYHDLFMTRADGLRRRIAGTGVDDSDLLPRIRETFRLASNYLASHLKNSDHVLKLHDYWARMEMNIAGDLTAFRGVMETMIKINATAIDSWKGYIQMEINGGHIREARSIYKRCYRKRFDGSGSEDICLSWLLFERQYGTLEDYDAAVTKVKPRLEELDSFKPSSAPASVPVPVPVRSNKVAGASKPKKESSDVQPVAAAAKQSKQYPDKCTAFVSNVNTRAADRDLMDFFSDVGGVVAVRILKDRNTGKSRGLAYVDFTDDDRLEAAVRKNRNPFLGKKVSIARSDPSKKRGGAAEHGKKPRFNDGAMKPFDGQGNHPGFVGSNTFAVPRAVRPLGWQQQQKKQKMADAGGEDNDLNPKSNEEFRKLLFQNK